MQVFLTFVKCLKLFDELAHYKLLIPAARFESAVQTNYLENLLIHYCTACSQYTYDLRRTYDIVVRRN